LSHINFYFFFSFFRKSPLRQAQQTGSN